MCIADGEQLPLQFNGLPFHTYLYNTRKNHSSYHLLRKPTFGTVLRQVPGSSINDALNHVVHLGD